MAAHEVPPSVVIGQGAVWVANKLDNSLSRIDPQTNRVVATTAADDGVADLAAGRDAVWTGGDRRGVARVVRIASRTNRVVATVPVTYQPAGLAVTDDAVWVTSFVGGTLWRIDPQTNSATSIRMAGKPNAIAVGADAAWVKNSDRRTVQRIDPQTNAVMATLPVASGLYGLAVDRESLWSVDGISDTVHRTRLPE